MLIGSLDFLKIVRSQQQKNTIKNTLTNFRLVTWRLESFVATETGCLVGAVAGAGGAGAGAPSIAAAEQLSCRSAAAASLPASFALLATRFSLFVVLCLHIEIFSRRAFWPHLSFVVSYCCFCCWRLNASSALAVVCALRGVARLPKRERENEAGALYHGIFILLSRYALRW